MEIVVVSVKDRLANCYSQPMFFATIGLAIRAFQDTLADPQSNMSKHPDDYDLYHLATYNDDTGTFANQEQPKQIALGKQIRQQ